MNYSWEHIRTQVRQFRANLQAIYPVQVLAITKDFAIHDNVLYFLSNNRDASDWCPTRQMQIYQSRLDQCNTHLVEQDDKNYLMTISTIPIMERSLVFNDYIALVENELDKSTFYRQLQIPGVSTFDIKDDTIMFTFQHDLYIGKLGKIPRLIPYKSASASTNNRNTPTNTSPTSAYSPIINDIDMDSISKQTPYTNTQEPPTDQSHRSDPKLGGFFNDRIAFVRNRDIWVTDWNGNDTQLTFCSSDTSDPSLKCGVAEYMMQEEFHRFTGYYWSPPITNTKQRTERILYLETSESQVEQVFISKSSSSSSSTSTPPSMTDTTNTSAAAADSIRYPRAGKPNAKSTIKIVEFEIGDTSPVNIRHKQLWGKNEIRALFPWVEYIVRFGWLPDGQSVWLQLLSRDQQTSAVVKLHLDQFSIEEENRTGHNGIQTEILWHETSTAWININDVYYFMQSSDTATVTKLIWSSEKVNGYRHLFLVEKSVDQQEAQVTQLTEGEWCCVNRPLYVDEARSLVYFSAKMHTPLESHFYVTSYSHHQHRPCQPTLLTKLGFSHTITMDSPDYFVDCFSTLHDPQVTVVQKLSHTKANPVVLDSISLLIPVSLRSDCETPPSPPSSTTNLIEGNNYEICRYSTDPLIRDLEHTRESNMSKYNDSVEPNGEIFSFTTSDGEKLYGCLYKPNNYQAGRSYPTLLHIYGGPTTQLVVNEFKFPRLIRYLMAAYFGFAVVIIDSRGSSDRGLKFESHIQYRLGTVELKDQLEGLQFLQDTKFGALLADHQDELVSVVDLNRLAITGWSYGGYLSLMALAQYPDRFKMSIAGAPVTQWELYDAAYTERYMGKPEENPQPYRDSNVLTYVDRFPNNENRLLIAHGLIDENVHFKNTELLVSQLVKLKKPHYLQVYPSEKHGLRHASVNEHFETLMFYWLSNYL
ncbi:Myblike DNAbinding domain-containing protein [Mucor velutinosus]|uniref:Myblike DNAbinding domain-containing protein n=1 Tax=Mucor velutinosus TaxID=708070 RepID=A0AAN7DE85_9FUNG|nr:Myblike DNAbinding domain-containing protein [Mucor velutinosus]